MDKEEPEGVDPLYAPSEGEGEEPKVDSMPVQLDAEDDLDAEEHLEGEELANVTQLPDVSLPTPIEIARHNLTHLPYRAWCSHCVRGKGLSRQHRRIHSALQRAIPLIVMDYMFMGRHDDPKVSPILLVKDTRSRAVLLLPVPCKGTSFAYVTDFALDFLIYLGYPKITIKTDGEPAIETVKEELTTKYKRNGEVEVEQAMVEDSAVGDSQANGEAEVMARHGQAQIRTLKSAMETNYQIKINNRHPVLAWMVLHAGSLITKFHVGSDGRTPYQRLRGKPWNTAGVEFGECIFYQPLVEESGKLAKLEDRYRDGIFLGYKDGSNEVYIGTEGGVTRSHSIKRKPLEHRWNKAELESLIGLPWLPSPGNKEKALPRLIDADAIEKRVPAKRTSAQESNTKAFAPRSVSIRKNIELEKYG